MKKFWEDFKKFITRGNVVDMAVGVTVAAAFTAIVNAFTKGIINPLVGLLTRGIKLTDLMWSIKVDGTWDKVNNVFVWETVDILYGELCQKIIDFLIIAFTLFVALRIFTAVTARAAKIREKAYAAVHAKELEEAEALAAEEAAKAEAEAKAKAEEEARIAAEEAAKAEAEAAEKAAKEKAEAERLAREEALLTEIRDLLKSQAK